jgi:hypothetical protein
MAMRMTVEEECQYFDTPHPAKMVSNFFTSLIKVKECQSLVDLFLFKLKPAFSSLFKL